MRHPSARRRAVTATLGVVALAAVLPLGLRAQSRSASTPAAGTAVQSGAPRASADTGKLLELEDYGRWNRITSPALSADGKWMTFTYSPNEGGQTILHVKELDGTRDYTASVGTPPAGGGRAGGGGRGGAGAGTPPPFSSDSRWAAYMVTPQARTAAGRGGRGRGGPATPPATGAAVAPEPAAVAHLELLNLATGEKIEFPGAASWKFSTDARWLAVKLTRPGAAAAVAANAAGAGGRGGAAAAPAAVGRAGS